MEDVIIIKIKTDTPVARNVLAESGYMQITDAEDSYNERFKKGDKFYRFAFPIWEMNNQRTRFTGVRIVKIDAMETV